MAKKTFSKLPKNKQEEIKERYIQGETIMGLADEYGLTRTSIQYHANKHWDTEKELLKAELFQKFSSNKKENFLKMSQHSITIITRALQAMANNPNPPTVMEAKRATEILESLDKITRLDEGKPTDITEEKVATAKELREKLSIDPFADVEEVEYVEKD
jgi:hypothetical protein